MVTASEIAPEIAAEAIAPLNLLSEVLTLERFSRQNDIMVTGGIIELHHL